jgi:uncharacterized protein YndB with AHSA1/START domain
MTTTHSAVLTLPSDTQILMTREFAAPAHLVFRALTTPELIKRWWSGGRGEVTVAEVDLRVGGRWRHLLVTEDGYEVGFHGEYREIVPAQRIVCTEAFEGAPEAPAAVCTYTFEESDGRTTLSVLTEVSDRQVRDAIIDTGMEDGAQDSWDALEQVAASLR